MKKLFEEVRLGRLRLKNRLVRSATWEALADGTVLLRGMRQPESARHNRNPGESAGRSSP